MHIKSDKNEEKLNGGPDICDATIFCDGKLYTSSDLKSKLDAALSFLNTTSRNSNLLILAVIGNKFAANTE